MTIQYAAEFRKRFKKLPAEIQEAFQAQEEIFKVNWRDPRLHTKKLKGEPVAFSFRITRRYRVLFVFVGSEAAVFITIGHRKEVYD